MLWNILKSKTDLSVDRVFIKQHNHTTQTIETPE